MKKLALVAVVAAAFSIGCASMPDVTPEDLDRLTLDLERLHDGIAKIDTSYMDDSTAHALDDVRTVAGKAATVSDLLARVKRGAK
jgi:hypothetical protein